MPKYAVLDFNGTVFENRDEKPFFKGMLFELLKKKVWKGQFGEAYRVLGFKKETEKKIEDYRKSRDAVSGDLMNELDDQHKQLQLIYDMFNEKIVSDPLVTADFVKTYTRKFAEKNKKKIDDRLIWLTYGLTNGILSVAYRKGVCELLAAAGYSKNFSESHIAGNIMETEDGSVCTLYDKTYKEVHGYERGKPRAFRLDINETNKAEFLNGLFFRPGHFEPKESVYVGDSKSDIPCFELVTSEGGIATIPPFVIDALHGEDQEIKKEAEDFVQLGSKHGLKVPETLRELELILK